MLARFLQGVGGAMMTPVARLVLVRSTPKRQLVSALAWLTIPALIGPMVGPPVGGFITTFFSWHWIFIINVPIGIAGILLAGAFLPEVPPAGTGRIDWLGFVLSALAAAGVVFGLSVVSLPALPPIVGILAMLLGAVAAVLYVRHARRSPRPLLDLRLFSNPVFRTAVVGGALFRIGNGAVPFLLPLLLQLGFGMTPFQSGMLTFATAIGAFAMKFLAPYTLRLGGFRTTLATTAVLSSLLIAANGLFTAETPGWAIIAVLVTAGFFRSLLFTSVNALVFADIEDKDASQATAIGAVTAADQHRARRGDRRRRAGGVCRLVGRGARPLGLHRRLRGDRGDHRLLAVRLPDAVANCRQRGVRPSPEGPAAGAAGGGRREAAVSRDP